MLVESRILGFGIGSTAQGIRNPSIDWIPESKFHWQRLDPLPGIRDPRRGVQNPRLSWIPLYGLITRPGKIEIHYKTSCTKGHCVLKPTLSHSDNFLFGFFKEKRRKKEKNIMVMVMKMILQQPWLNLHLSVKGVPSDIKGNWNTNQ